MAPPRHRDRGFSRRIQYGLFFGYVAAIVGVVVGLFLLLIARFYPVAFEGVRGMALDATAPVSAAGRPLARGATSLGEEIGGYLNAGAQNLQLRRELAEARRGIIEARITAYENQRLKRALRLIEHGTTPLVSARIVGSDLSGHRRYATLAAGAGEGVHAGQPVRAPEGLVGRVAEAGQGWSRIELLTDGGSTVPVRILRTGQPALVAGRGDGALDVRSTLTGARPFQRGDLLVSSGTGGVFPAGIPVAVVTSVNGEVASARALADPARLDIAFVLPESVMAPPPPLPAKAR